MQYVLATIRAPPPAGADPVLGREVPGVLLRVHAQAAVDAGPGRRCSCSDNVVSEAARARAARSKGSASCRARSRRSCRPTCGGSARPASSAAASRRRAFFRLQHAIVAVRSPGSTGRSSTPSRPGVLDCPVKPGNDTNGGQPITSHQIRRPEEAERADDQAPPREQREAVAGHVVEEALDHEPAGDERHDEADRDHDELLPSSGGRRSCRGRRRRRRPWWAWRDRTRIPPPSAGRRRTAWPTRWSRRTATRRGSWRGTGRCRCRDRSAARTSWRHGSAA